MSYTKDPHYAKSGCDTTFSPSAGAKRVKMQYLDIENGTIADLGKAPTSRVYTRNYAKTTETYTSEDVDLITPALGNPKRL
jgi:hypothetical protein